MNENTTTIFLKHYDVPPYWKNSGVLLFCMKFENKLTIYYENILVSKLIHSRMIDH